MRVIVPDYTARGHALADAAIRSKEVERAFLAPGNAQDDPDIENTWIDPTDFDALFRLVSDNEIDLTIASQDALLAAGLVNEFRREFKDRGYKIFGPTKEAAQIESSKDFMKNVVERLNIPTARSNTYGTEMGVIIGSSRFGYRVVVKADMLAAGKGVKPCESREDVIGHLANLRKGGYFGSPGQKALVEEYLEGPEISLHAWCDGETYRMFPFAMQDYKTIDTDEGSLMTGGMGVVLPVPGVTPQMVERLGEQFVRPVLEELKRLGMPFQGVLYPGLILTKDGPKVLEYNARPGAPETEAWAPTLMSDLSEIALACESGRLADLGEIKWRSVAAACIVLAAQGYPENPQKGAPVQGLQNLERVQGLKVYHGGTKREKSGVVVNGGRVLSLVAVGREGETLPYVTERAYEAADPIRFGGCWPALRKGIGNSALDGVMRERIDIMRGATS